MLNPNVQNQQGQQTAPPAGTETPPADQAMSFQAFVDDMTSRRMPQGGFGEELTPEQLRQEEINLKNETRFMLQDLEVGVREVAPYFTRADMQKLSSAYIDGDGVALVQVVESAVRKAIEKEQNEKPLEDLRTEPAGSGTRGNERPPVRSMREAMMNISDAFSD